MHPAEFMVVLVLGVYNSLAAPCGDGGSWSGGVIRVQNVGRPVTCREDVFLVTISEGSDGSETLESTGQLYPVSLSSDGFILSDQSFSGDVVHAADNAIANCQPESSSSSQSSGSVEAVSPGIQENNGLEVSDGRLPDSPSNVLSSSVQTTNEEVVNAPNNEEVPEVSGYYYGAPSSSKNSDSEQKVDEGGDDNETLENPDQAYPISAPLDEYEVDEGRDDKETSENSDQTYPISAPLDEYEVTSSVESSPKESANENTEVSNCHSEHLSSIQSEDTEQKVNVESSNSETTSCLDKTCPSSTPIDEQTVAVLDQSSTGTVNEAPGNVKTSGHQYVLSSTLSSVYPAPGNLETFGNPTNSITVPVSIIEHEEVTSIQIPNEKVEAVSGPSNCQCDPKATI